jgi:hypothetical protein
MGQPNYEESRVPAYTLPDPLASVSSREDWSGRKRAEILRIFEDHVYGRTPRTPVQLTVLSSREKEVAPGLVRGLVELEVRCQGRRQVWQLLIFRPPGAGPWPVFLGMNFCGNQTVYPDAEIPLARGWVDNNESLGIRNHEASEASRGGRWFRWPVERLVSRGYALCTLYYGDVDPDYDDGFENGAHQLLGQKEGWGSIGAWAWGLSRCADYLLEQSWVDRLAVVGHSRLGKAALWAGAQDARFSLVISNDSGCGGASLARRHFGETVEKITKQFPHWFIPRYAGYGEREGELPVDQHELMALVAPRCLYVASAASDFWADPRGEELALQNALPVFRLVGGETSYHCRPGMHNLTGYDWERFMDFADRHWHSR